MQNTEDSALLRRYAENQSDEAFAGLVARHINLVYSVALRQTGNPHHAEEVTQAVFVILAKKAPGLRHDKALGSWLFQTTRLTANNFVRSELRRQRREQEAYMQSVLNESGDPVWEKIAPLLDTAVAGLNEKDRRAIVLRFYEGRNLREVGQALGANEEAAKKRIARALEKLQGIFLKQGVASTTAGIAGAISSHSVQAAPALLAKTATALALAKGATASTATLTLIKGTLKIMTWTKINLTVAVSVAAILAIGTTTLAVKKFSATSSSPLEIYFKNLSSTELETAPPALILRSSRYAGQGDAAITGRDAGPDGKILRRGCSFGELLSTAYGYGPEQMVLPANVPQGSFDLLLTVANGRQALQAEIKKRFGLAAQVETRDTDVAILKSVNPATPSLKTSGGGGPNISLNKGELKLVGYKMSNPPGNGTMDDVAHVLGLYFVHLPVIDETGLAGTYDMDLKWKGATDDHAQKKEMAKALRDQLGLVLTPARQPIQMLVVEKTD